MTASWVLGTPRDSGYTQTLPAVMRKFKLFALTGSVDAITSTRTRSCPNSCLLAPFPLTCTHSHPLVLLQLAILERKLYDFKMFKIFALEPPDKTLTKYFYEGSCFEFPQLLYFNCHSQHHRCMFDKLTCARASASSLLRFSASSCACSSSSWPRLDWRHHHILISKRTN